MPCSGAAPAAASAPVEPVIPSMTGPPGDVPAMVPVIPSAVEPSSVPTAQAVIPEPVGAAGESESTFPAGAFGKAFMDASHFPDWEPLDRDSLGWEAVLLRDRKVRGEHQYLVTFPSCPEVRPQYYRADQLSSHAGAICR